MSRIARCKEGAKPCFQRVMTAPDLSADVPGTLLFDRPAAEVAQLRQLTAADLAGFLKVRRNALCSNLPVLLAAYNAKRCARSTGGSPPMLPLG